MLWEIWPGVEVRTAPPSKNVQLVPLLADRPQASYWKHCYAGCDRCLFWFPVAFLLSQHHNTVCVHAQLHTVNVFLPEQELSGEISGLPVDWWERRTEPRGIVGGSAEPGRPQSQTHTVRVPAQGRWWKLGKPRLTPSRTRSTLVAGCPEVEVSLLRNHSLRFRVASLYIWQQGHQNGSGSRTPAGTITYSLRWLREQQEHCVCVCVLSQSHTHMLAESHFPVTPLYLAALLGVIVGFEFLF